MDTPTIDAHQHFWQYNPIRDAWIDDNMAVLRRNFMPNDLAPLLARNGIDGCIAVQADQSDAETQFLLDLADQYPFIAGVVGWADLRSPLLQQRLEALSDSPKLCGFRHILQTESPDRMLEPDFLAGIAALRQFGYTYDVLVYPHHLDAVYELLYKNSDQRFIIDHLAKPGIKQGQLDDWAKKINRIAQMDHVYCKLSGMVTEADWHSWQPEDLFPYWEVVLEAFGTRRVCYGSDWPVCLLAADYDRQLGVIRDCIAPLSETEQAAIMGGNTSAFYGTWTER